jgi:2-amino-4-hydroxy-6-hydroxymethyldihydropteridine diphosphokinase
MTVGPGEAGTTRRQRDGRHRVVLALGSNLGDRLSYLQEAVTALVACADLSNAAVSAVYQTEPVGGPPQPGYLNAVLTGETGLPARAVLECGRRAERTAGRVRAERWGARTLDVDVIAYGTEVSDDPDLTLPHPRAHERAFVLVPWHELEPEAQLPRHGRIADLLAGLDTAGVQRLAGAWLRLAA